MCHLSSDIVPLEQTLEKINKRLYVNSSDREKRLYVNSWGRDKKEIIASRVGVKASARFLCTAEEDPVPEIAEGSVKYYAQN